MGSLIEMLANKKKAAAPILESAVVLPIVRKDHEGACGDGCGCAGGEEGGCCGG